MTGDREGTQQPLGCTLPTVVGRTMSRNGRGIVLPTRRHAIALFALTLLSCTPGPIKAASTDGQLTWGVHISLAPTWFDPAEMSGIITPYMVYYALHDALVKAMPGQPFAPSLAKSWTASDDGLVYEFVLRDGVKFHNGEPVTAEDVKFSYERYQGRRQQGAEGPGRLGRDPRSQARPLQAQAAVAGLHDLLYERHGRGVDRAEEVRGAGGRRRLQEGAHRRRPLQVRLVHAGPGADHGGQSTSIGARRPASSAWCSR